MRLKEIELHGFKSFAKKTKIKLDKQFSVIVGPNGCGKSNISDAIRWVLGEQSAKSLRGEKMEDVIFAGSPASRSMNYCKVSISFDNSDGFFDIDNKNLTIARTVYRTGESKYTINNKNVRLKDINELFLGTGLGKEGYSIISQGKIDQILSARPDERRTMLDEAAGVSKYKYKRQESIKKLENTVDNLNRIEDIMAETYRNKDYLEREANKAKKAISLRESLVQFELVYYRLIKGQADIDLEKLSVKVEKEELAIEKLGSLIEENSQERVRLKNFLSEYDKDLDKLRSDLKVKEDKYNQLFTEKVLSKEKLANNKKDKERLLMALDDSRQRIGNYSSELANKKKEKKNLEDDLVLIKEKKDLFDLELKDKEEALATLKKGKAQIDTSIEACKGEIDDFELSRRTRESLKDSHSKDLEQLHARLKSNEEERDELAGQLSVLDSRQKVVAKSLEHKSTSLKDSSDLLAKIKADQEDLTSRSKDLQGELSKISSNLNLLKEVHGNYEGFYRPVQRFLKEADKNPQLRGSFINPFADEIRVHEGYEKAIEYSLGSQLQNIITQTTQDAENIIAYLKSNKIGRLTFLPLDRYKVIPRRLGSLKEADYLAFAADVVDFDCKLKNLIENLLGRTIIVEDMKQASRLIGKSNNRIVTLDGDIINTGGSIVGGSNKAKEYGLINRGSQIEDLEAEKLDRENSLLDIKTSLNRLEKEFVGAMTNYESLSEELNQAENQLETLSKEIQSLTYAIKLAESEIKKTKEDIASKKLLLSSYSPSNYESLEEIQNKLAKLNKEAELYRADQEKLEEDCKKREIQLIGLENRIESLERDLKISSNDLIELSDNINNEKNSLANLDEELADLNKTNLDLTTLISKCEEEIKLLEDGIVEAKAKISRLENESSQARSKRDDLNEKLIADTSRYKDLEMQVSTSQAQITSIIDKLSKQEAYLSKEYGLTWDDLETSLSQDQIEDQETRQIEAKIKDLRKEYLKVANYNEYAIEEFDKINEDYQFYMKQKNDLLRSKEDVEELIEELEIKIAEEFACSFKLINEKFSEIFTKLFGAGKAKLVLENNDELSAGIDIEVEMPGKNKQNLNLLSGGERALTAVSLLFAIFETNPAPFCVLDEADAALDEANINRYIDYLKSLEDIQFIIITHRKRTMEVAERIYGVTMEDEGISKVVNLELDKAVNL